LRSTHDDVEAALGQVRVPLLAVVGDKEPALPDVQRLSQIVPNAQLVILPGEDHFSASRAQTSKEAVASFLKEHSYSTA
jgi:pimeloyl-ACP methyl ester carboxylesterase